MPRVVYKDRDMIAVHTSLEAVAAVNTSAHRSNQSQLITAAQTVPSNNAGRKRRRDTTRTRARTINRLQLRQLHPKYYSTILTLQS